MKDREPRFSRRDMLMRGLPIAAGALAGAIGAGIEDQIVDDSRINTLEEQVENHEKVLGIHSRVLISHDIKLKGT